jgi:hypothetical protein
MWITPPPGTGVILEGCCAFKVTDVIEVIGDRLPGTFLPGSKSVREWDQRAGSAALEGAEGCSER